jgi:hypothetical protein
MMIRIRLLQRSVVVEEEAVVGVLVVLVGVVVEVEGEWVV